MISLLVYMPGIALWSLSERRTNSWIYSNPYNLTDESTQLSIVTALAFFSEIRSAALVFLEKTSIFVDVTVSIFFFILVLSVNNVGYLLAVKETWHKREKKNVLEFFIKFEKVQLPQSKKAAFLEREEICSSIV